MVESPRFASHLIVDERTIAGICCDSPTPLATEEVAQVDGKNGRADNEAVRSTAGLSGGILMINRRWLLCWFVILSAMIGSFTTARSSFGNEPASKGTIGVSLLTLTNPFFKTIGDSITRVAAKEGYSVVVVSGDFDVAKQQNQIKDFIVKRVAAIVLSPCDSKSIGPAIQEANDAGIPVFTCDIKSLAANAKVVTHVATDNYQGGKMAGQAMIEALGSGGGKIAILDAKEIESCLLRVKGFKEVIASHNTTKPNAPIQIVAELPSYGQKERGYKSAEDCLQAHGDLAGIFAVNDPAALGACAAIEKAGKSDQIKVVGFDGQSDGRQAIKDGKIYADPVQFPDRIGTKTMQTILAYFEGDRVPHEILIPTALYRKADAMKDSSLR
jgi:ribose transport system substrate-binding protein